MAEYRPAGRTENMPAGVAEYRPAVPAVPAASTAPRIPAASTASRSLAELRLESEHGFRIVDNTLIDVTTTPNCPFNFYLFDSPAENHYRYHVVGLAVTEVIYAKLEQLGLLRESIPKEETNHGPSFFFASPDVRDNPNKLLVLIHGNGAVRAGQWSRRIIMNEPRGLDKGSQLPHIRQALHFGYAVIVMNTNEIDKADTPESHAEYIWQHYVQQSAAKTVVIIAHSYGGFVTAELMHRHRTDFQHRVRAVALSDSVPFSLHDNFEDAFINQRTRSWVACNKPVGTPVGNGTCVVSAGHEKHEWTPYTSMENMFMFLEHQLANPVPDNVDCIDLDLIENEKISVKEKFKLKECVIS